MDYPLPSTKLKNTTIQISRVTKKYLDELKDKEQLSSYDAVIRVVLLNYKLFQELNKKEQHQDKKEND